ncbi:sigma-54-dependent Fis family transcriptional regulator [Priestia megaterium]|uniref:sigma-54-dependent Fis family transcriptional regulator n=1 Tax=Priestia megaterium TaxID=1404 RepID=UPI0013E2F96C|nr:sigma-54-dependent Fis family transcriptional regulator [Priestia megaterium]MED3865467.1 sigma 54-interacting transcriptional regulator [Priestia megaterium]MED4098776.1 sigma 54-interacting transcriptional regulator [Priestia megaterium]MED4143476.1 sigma 54-interacting transcriptional regulator [Priestia megaterium]MED4166315.1 sigma 54-interacting transcriptional regulator [Priestia megaterium]MED4200543.1 sigma 54-interacting transcriptional regulator [Priestia megaterium]
MLQDFNKYAPLDYNQIKNNELVHRWMRPLSSNLTVGQTLKEAFHLLDMHGIEGLPVVSPQQKVVGMLTTSELIRSLTECHSLNTKVEEVMKPSINSVSPYDSIDTAWKVKEGILPVIDEKEKLVGVLTKTDILHSYSFYLKHLQENLYAVETLDAVLESAYEGIVIVDTDGIIKEFNEAYCRFLGKKREEAIGKHVTEIIENTRVHIVSETGTDERGYVQHIQGQDMIVHRIPIRKEGKIVGAIGMLIFEGVSELYNILGRMQELSRKVTEAHLPNHEQTENNNHFDQIIGESPAIQTVKEIARKAAKTPSTVLITGESGTGKELFAKAIHYSSPFSEGPFVSINCAAIPEQLLEAELFGYEEGAFTGARKGGKPGKFEQAHKGTLFLDEIGDMPLLMQAKILRVLQDREVERVGGMKSQHVDVRIIAATNKRLEDLVKKGEFREDLYYRLNIIRLSIPPLIERKEDIQILLIHHLKSFCEKFGIIKKSFSFEAMRYLQEYQWPGNIRELVNTVEMLVSLVENQEITEKDLPAHFRKKDTSSFITEKTSDTNRLLKKVREDILSNEKDAILKALADVNGNKAAAARILGIQRSTLYIKLKKYGL